MPEQLERSERDVPNVEGVGSSPASGTQFMEGCQSAVYWGVLLRRWPFKRPMGSNPILSALHSIRHPR